MTVAIALMVGMVGQSLAYHLRLPGIVILLLFGVLLGPDGFGVVDPDVLGDGLHVIVGFAIAVILFEGGMNLEWKQLRREAATIQRLVTLGAVVTWMGGAFAAAWIMGWDTRHAILFGSLVIVTGPTVVAPLLRRIRVRRNLQTILEAEGVFIDAIGAIIAVVAFDIVFVGDVSGIGAGALSVLGRLGTGALIGIVSGGLMMLLLSSRRVIPAGMEKVFTLTLAWATFQVSNAVQPDSGILAVIVAGVMAANVAQETTRGVREFKEQLTVMMVGMLFVLLAAQVRVSDVTSLGWRGVGVVAALMFVVRPLGVLACTTNSGLTWREKAFLPIAPRGIVAASATLFYEAWRRAASRAERRCAPGSWSSRAPCCAGTQRFDGGGMAWRQTAARAGLRHPGREPARGRARACPEARRRGVGADRRQSVAVQRGGSEGFPRAARQRAR
jgi:NhaP-type Na+/H+ or K+/H+ antiporter